MKQGYIYLRLHVYRISESVTITDPTHGDNLTLRYRYILSLSVSQTPHHVIRFITIVSGLIVADSTTSLVFRQTVCCDTGPKSIISGTRTNSPPMRLGLTCLVLYIYIILCIIFMYNLLLLHLLIHQYNIL